MGVNCWARFCQETYQWDDSLADATAWYFHWYESSSKRNFTFRSSWYRKDDDWKSHRKFSSCDIFQHKRKFINKQMGGIKLKTGPNLVPNSKNKATECNLYWLNRLLALLSKLRRTVKFEKSKNLVLSRIRRHKDELNLKNSNNRSNQSPSITGWRSQKKIHQKTLHSSTKSNKQISVVRELE